MPSSRGSSRPRDQTCILWLLCWQAYSFPLAPPGKPAISWSLLKFMSTELVVLSNHLIVGCPSALPFCCALQRAGYLQIAVCGNPVGSRAIGAIFLRAFAHLVSPSHILVILSVSNPPPTKRLQLPEGSDYGLYFLAMRYF